VTEALKGYDWSLHIRRGISSVTSLKPFASRPIAIDNIGTMKRHRILLLWSWLLIPLAAFSQDQEAIEARNKQLERQQILENERRVEETRRMFDKLAEQQSAPNPGSRGPSKGSSERGKFFQTVPLFREATSRYREGIGLTSDLKPLTKGIERLIDPLQDYFETQRLKRESVNPADLQGLTPEELSWETLTVAERIDNNLQLALQFVMEAEREGAIDVRVLEFFGDIQDDLNRLKWLVSKGPEVARSQPDRP
jgi:hypothetical protein